MTTTKLAMPLMPADDGRSGIYTYIKQVSKWMLETAPTGCSITFFCLDGDREYFQDLPRKAMVRVPDSFAHPVSNIGWHLGALPIMMKKLGMNALLLPAGNRRLAPFSNVDTTVVVHDLNQLVVDGKYDAFRTLYVKKFVFRGITHARTVVAVSQQTATQLRQLGVPPSRITVIPNGVDRERFEGQPRDAIEDTLQRLGLQEGYLFYVSRIEHPGKNHATLLEAYAALKARREIQGASPPPALVFAGQDWNGAEQIHGRASALALDDDVHFLGFVEDADLPRLYAGAGAFVFPSLAEGFGLPLLEAMAANTPVLCSNRPPMSQIVADAGVQFDPEDVDGIAAALERVLGDDSLRDCLRERGRRRLDLYDWEAGARELWTLIHEQKRKEARYGEAK